MATATPRSTKAAGPRKALPTKSATRRAVTKPGAMPSPRQSLKSTPHALAKPATVVHPPAGTPKSEKPKKPKLVRDSFTIPKAEYAVIEQLKQRAAQAGTPAKKSEVLRAGIKALAAMGDAAFLAALGGVPAIKTGRPAKE